MFNNKKYQQFFDNWNLDNPESAWYDDDEPRSIRKDGVDGFDSNWTTNWAEEDDDFGNDEGRHSNDDYFYLASITEDNSQIDLLSGIVFPAEMPLAETFVFAVDEFDSSTFENHRANNSRALPLPTNASKRDHGAENGEPQIRDGQFVGASNYTVTGNFLNPFYLDPSLLPDIVRSPSDPLFQYQWHLHNTTPGEYDLNVLEVWDDYTGDGVQIAVIDDGFDTAHKDFDNYADYKDWDFYRNDANAGAEDSNDSHGTAVMGIIGADRDGYGCVGVAYDSTLIGYRMGYGENVPANQVSSAINKARSVGVDVVNMSFGLNGDFSPNKYTDDLISAIDNAIDFGRDKLGTILVKSAGNSRYGDWEDQYTWHDDPDDTNNEASAAHRGTITVAAVNRDGSISDYSTPGASVLVSAFGTDGEVVTTDRTGKPGYNYYDDHTYNFSGTSAAAPMVSGIVGLMLEANDDLGWRDVQDILAYSARHVGSDVGSKILQGAEENAWQWNGADNWNGGGLHFSNDYGFGLVDAHAAVRLAESWTSQKTSSNDQVTTKYGLQYQVTPPDGDNRGANYQVSFEEAYRIEHVSLNINFSTTYFGDVGIYLVSPDNTRSELICRTDIDGDFGANWDGNWTFSSNAFRGEMSDGTWTVNIIDYFSGDTLVVKQFGLNIYTCDAKDTINDTYVYTNEFLDYNGQDKHKTTLNDTDGGTDTLNAAAVTYDTVVNLQTGKAVIANTYITSISGIENIMMGDGNDDAYGSNSSNMISGGRGNDTLVGQGGMDVLIGGAGNDLLVGGVGESGIFYGDYCMDTFVFRDDSGWDLIRGFEDGFDKIDMSEKSNLSYFSQLYILDGNFGALVMFENDTIEIENIKASQLTEADFII